jgi:hypothetical protein
MSLARDIADLASVTTRLDTVGASSGALSNRNLIINGSQIVNQRGTQTVNASATAVYGPDRFRINAGGGIDNFVGTIAQDSDVPAGSGFSNSLKITTTTAESAIAAGEYIYLHQTIEAQNLQQLAYGTSSAKKVTLSFWVKSTITGTFALGLYKPDSTSQIHVKTYTINDASTWEYKTITFEANALSGGAIANDNGAGIEVNWHLAVGSTYKGTDTSSSWANYSNAAWGNGQGTDAVITTTNATFQITGCQLEVGSQSTDFEHRSFADELARCQRYFCRTYPYGTSTGTASSNSSVLSASQAATTYMSAGNFRFPVEMRAAPTVVVYSTQNANTTAKVTSDATDGNGLASFTGSTSTFLHRSNDSSGVNANTFVKAHATAEAEL